MEDFLYRYVDRIVSAGVDEFDNPLGPGKVEIYLRKLPVLKHTPKGTWIDDYGRKRFVLSQARKKYAALTIDAAQESFIKRKEAQRRIYLTRASQAAVAIEVMQRQSCKKPT